MADKLNKLSEAQISSLTKSELSGLLNGVLREILTNTDETNKISRELSNKVDIVTADLSIVKHDVQNLRGPWFYDFRWGSLTNRPLPRSTVRLRFWANLAEIHGQVHTCLWSGRSVRLFSYLGLV